MSYKGDYRLGKTFYHRFTTVNASGLPTTLGNSPTLQYYVEGGTTGFTSGLTLSADFNSVTGLNSVQVIATSSCTGLVTQKNISVVIAAGTVSGVSVVGYPVLEYSLENRSALMPTTADRTLTVASTGGAAIDWASVGNPGSTVSLSATTLFTTTNVTNDVGAIVTAINTLVNANITAYSTVIAANVTSASTNVGAVVTSVSTVVQARVTSISASGLASLFLTDSGTTYASAVAGSPVKEIADNAGGSALTVTAIASVVWERALPGAFVAGSAGYILGTNLDTTVGSRLATASITLAAGAVTVGTNNDKTGYSTTDFTTAMTESYRANGATATPAQALYELIAHHGEASISGTTKTINKIDHSTGAETFTLDSATAPTSVTRAT